MKKLSLQWRITLMTTVLICITCVLMNCLIGSSGKRYMDSIGNGISAYSEIDKGKPSSFNPEKKNLDRELTIIISGAQASFNTTNWYITTWWYTCIFCQWSCFKVAKKFCLSSREYTAKQFGRYENKRRCFA